MVAKMKQIYTSLEVTERKTLKLLFSIYPMFCISSLAKWIFFKRTSFMALSISIVKFVKFSREYFMYCILSVILLNCTAYKSLCLAKYASF